MVARDEALRNAVSQAGSAYNTAASTGATLGGEAQGIGANLTPFLTQEMLHPQGLGQQGITAEESAALGGAGGAASGLVGQAAQRAAVSRNSGGFQAALDDAARQRDKAAAGSSEGIMAQNERMKEGQRQAGASGLEHQYGVDTSGMLNAMDQEHQDINSEVNASNSGWLQNAMNIIKTLNGTGSAAASMKTAGMF